MDKPNVSAPLDVWLIGLIQDFDQDPQKCFQNGKPQVALEKISSANNICFWRATAHIDGLEINWGVQGNAGNRRFYALDTCRLQNPIMELRKRMEEKLAKTYRLNNYQLIN